MAGFNIMRCFIAIILFKILSVALASGNYSDDNLVVGPYVISRCGSKGEPNSRATRLSRIIPRMIDDLNHKIIPDAKLGFNSSHGFGTFFGLSSSVQFVTDIFEQIASGHQVMGHDHVIRPVTFICANADDNKKSGRSFYKKCTSNPYVPMAVVKGTEVVMICPLLWEGEDFLPPSQCPQAFNSTAMIVAADSAFGEDTFSTIVHELAHIYGIVGRPEAYDFGELVDLSPERQLQNAQNFGFYAEGELPPKHYRGDKRRIVSSADKCNFCSRSLGLFWFPCSNTSASSHEQSNFEEEEVSSQA